MSDDSQQVKLHLPEHLVRAMKVAAILRGTTVSNFTAEALRAFITTVPPMVPGPVPDGDGDAD